MVFKIRKSYLLLVVFTAIVAIAGIYFAKLMAGSIEDRQVAAMSWSVAGKTIVVDPGHGGIDPGSKSSSGLEEATVTLDVSKKLKEVLTGAGATVVMTRESDIDYGAPDESSLLTRKRQDLAKRLSIAEKNKANVYLSVHVNCFKSGPGEHGAQVFYQPGSGEGKKLAESIQGEMARVLGNTARVAKGVDYYATRNSKMPAVIVELGFISNPREEKLLSEPEYQRKLAFAVYCGLIKYFAGNATAAQATDRNDALETLMNNKGHVVEAP